jgi:lipopolysaccharide transport system permease protein
MEDSRTIIIADKRISLRLRELWQYRELFYFFTWRDIKVKYKQTYLGITWAVLQPVSLMFLFTFIFPKSLKFESGAIRYEVFVLSGLVLWGLFYSAVAHASESIIQQSNIIKKIYFPRLIIPCSAILVSLFDFLIAFTVFLLISAWYGQRIALSALYLFPAAILLVIVSAFGMGTLLSALTVKYRDFRYALPFLLQFLFFASGVIYSVKTVGDSSLQNLLALNPVNGAIELIRSPLGNGTNLTAVLISCISAAFVSLAGLFYFRNTEAYFADLV